MPFLQLHHDGFAINGFRKSAKSRKNLLRENLFFSGSPKKQKSNIYSILVSFHTENITAMKNKIENKTIWKV